MLRERTVLDWPLLVGLCAVTLDLMIGMPRVQQAPPPPPPDHAWVEDLRAAETTTPDPNAELRVEYERDLAIAFDNKAEPLDAFAALRRARSLDLVLDGGTRGDE